jgi:uncharacterized membrane protein YqjE
MDTETPPAPAGFVDSLRALGDGLLASVQGRVELVSIELQEEKYRLIQVFFWISAAIFTGMLALLFASLTLVYLFWESARLTVLGGLAIFYTSALVAIILLFRRFLARQPRPFAATLEEIGKDRTCIRTES